MSLSEWVMPLLKLGLGSMFNGNCCVCIFCFVWLSAQRRWMASLHARGSIQMGKSLWLSAKRISTRDMDITLWEPLKWTLIFGGQLIRHFCSCLSSKEPVEYQLQRKVLSKLHNKVWFQGFFFYHLLNVWSSANLLPL